MKWYKSLALESIESWKQMTELFIARFMTSNKRLKDIGALLTLKQRGAETLRLQRHSGWGCPETLIYIDL